MPQQTKTEALEELARLIRRDIMNGTARLNETWWFDDDTKMQDRIAHVLLDYSDEERPTELDKVSYNSRLDVFCAQIDELTEKCAALVVENKRLSEYASGNWADVPPPSDAGCIYPECGPTCRRDCPPAPAVETPAVEVKRAVKVGDRVRVRGENGEVVHVGCLTAEVRSHHTGKVGAYLIAEIEVSE